MITKTQLKNKVDSNNCFNFIAYMPWNGTSLARLYDAVAEQIEGGCLIDIVKARPTAFDLEKEIITVEILLNCSDALIDDEEEELAE